MATPRETDRKFVEGLIRWSADNLRDFPWRRPENLTPYRVLVAELLLKRTTASAATKAFGNFLTLFPDLKSLSAASYIELEGAFSPLGLHKQRARSTGALTDYLAAHCNSEIPSAFCELLKVPGIGQYSSRAVLSFGFDKPFAVVDGNVQRILGRVYGSTIGVSTPYLEHQKIVDKLLPVESHRQFNYALIDIGSIVCRPSIPKCTDCPLINMCDYRNGLSSFIGRPLLPEASSVKWAREHKKMSLVNLSKLSGVSKSTIVNIEKGRTNPTSSTITRLLEVLSQKDNVLLS